MNSRLPAPNGRVAILPEPEWLKRIDGWRQALQRCSQKPGKKRVHAMRVATLRLQAPLEVWLRERAADDVAVRAGRKWIKQAERLRKLLSAVRDLDVLLDLMSTMQSQDAKGVEARCRAGEACLRELGKLEQRLKRNRAKAKDEFAQAIEKKSSVFDAAGAALRKSFDDPLVGKAINASGALREAITDLVQDAPTLGAETLHDFRKKAKTARYLAEIVERYDPAARRSVALLKRIQAAAGEWHDWEMLAERAEEILKPGKKDELVPLLSVLAARSLESAVQETRSATVELAAIVNNRAEPLRFGVRRAVAEAAGLRRFA